jgi:adenylate kinase family enzyme
LSRILYKIRRLKKIKVFALVGDTGTGKSFRAKLVTQKYNIDLVIDDGLLIRDHRILAGRSAKREKNRVTAIKRAIFEDPDHIQDVRHALEDEKFRSILILGTSEKMIARIVERLHLPYPDKLIYIEDIASEEEIMQAKDSRQLRGKHVIPVPVIEVKQDPAHRVLDSIKIFLKRRSMFFWKKEIIEKTVVQPPFSRRGRLSISEAALSQMIMHCIQEYSKNVYIDKIIIDLTVKGYEVEIKLKVYYGLNLPELLAGLKDYIIRNIEQFSGIHIEALHLTVEHIEKSFNE